MDVVLVMFKDGKSRDFPMKGEKLTIGRSPDSDLRIPTPDVSRNHCEVLVDAGDLIVHDTGSSNGTYVNGEMVDETELSPGDQLRVGPVTFVVKIDGKPGEVEGPDVAAALSKGSGNEDTGDLLDLDDFDFDDDDDDDDPISAVEAMLDDDDD